MKSGFNQWKIELVKIRINWIQNEPISQNSDAFATIGTTVSVVLDQYGCASLKNTQKKNQKRKTNNIKKKNINLMIELNLKSIIVIFSFSYG